MPNMERRAVLAGLAGAAIATPTAASTALPDQLGPAERRLLLWLAAHADLIEVPGAPPHLLIAATPEVVDRLAAVGAELEDLESNGDDEFNVVAPTMMALPIAGRPEDLDIAEADRARAAWRARRAAAAAGARRPRARRQKAAGAAR